MEYVKTIKDPNGNKIFVMDIDAIEKDKFFFTIIMTGRGFGKSVGYKNLALERFKKDKKKTIYLLSNEEQVKLALPTFIDDNMTINEKQWKDVKREGNKLFYKKHHFMTIAAISTYYKLKLARDSSVEYIVYDEFSDGLSQIRHNQTQYFDNILQTFRSVKRVVLLSNSVTLAVPILMDLGIIEIKEEYTVINKMVKLYIPKLPEGQFEELYKDDNLYNMSKLLGTAKHNYGNESLLDTLNGIISEGYFIATKTLVTPMRFTYFINKRFFEWFCFYYEGHTNYLIKAVDKTVNDKIYCIKAKDQDQGYIFSDTLAKKQVREQLGKGRLWFMDQGTKHLVLNAIK